MLSLLKTSFRRGARPIHLCPQRLRRFPFLFHTPHLHLRCITKIFFLPHRLPLLWFILLTMLGAQWTLPGVMRILQHSTLPLSVNPLLPQAPLSALLLLLSLEPRYPSNVVQTAVPLPPLLGVGVQKERSSCVMHADCIRNYIRNPGL